MSLTRAHIAKKTIWILLTFMFAVTHLEAQYAAECVTPRNEPGKCVPIFSCANVYPIVERMFEYKSSEREVALVISSYCGKFNSLHHVCCADNQIELNKIGLERLQNATCGVFSAPRVAHGEYADLFAFPWMALLKFKTGKTFRCGATLISDRYVLTAAHCILGAEDVLTEVRLGEYNITSAEDCVKAGRKLKCAPPVEDIGIEQLFLHEGYEKYQLHHDIALIRLNRTVKFQTHIKPICLPSTQKLMSMTHTDYIVSGWGNTEMGESSDTLKWTTVPNRDRHYCNSKLQINGLDQGHICAGGEAFQDSCKGDSGGPLATLVPYKGRIPRFVQFGIVSLGVVTCGQISAPAIYTNVSQYMQWITDHMDD